MSFSLSLSFLLLSLWFQDKSRVRIIFSKMSLTSFLPLQRRLINLPPSRLFFSCLFFLLFLSSVCPLCPPPSVPLRAGSGELAPAALGDRAQPNHSHVLRESPPLVHAELRADLNRHPKSQGPRWMTPGEGGEERGGRVEGGDGLLSICLPPVRSTSTTTTIGV